MKSRFIAAIALLCFLSAIPEARGGDFFHSVKGNQVIVSNGKASSAFGGEFILFKADKDPEMELRTLTEVRYFAPSWIAGDIPPGKAVTEIKKSAATGGDGIDESLSGTVKGRTFDLFYSAPSVRLSPRSCRIENDTVRFDYPPCGWGKLRCIVYAPGDGGAPVLEYTFEPSEKGYYSVGYLGASGFPLDKVDALWQPMVWQRKIFPENSYMSLAFSCPVPAAMANSSDITTAVAADPSEFPFEPLPTRDNNRFGVAVRDDAGHVRPMLFAPVLGQAGSEMDPGDTFSFKARLWVEKAPVSTAFQSISRELFGFRDYRSNAISTLNNTIDNIIDYAMGPYSNFIDSLKGCSYSTDVPGSTKNVSSLNPLSVALLADDGEVYRKRAYPIIEYMISRENTLFCLDTTQKVQNPSRKLDGPCATTSELAGLYKLSGGKSGVFQMMAENKFYKNRPPGNRVKGAGGPWYDALEIYRATGEKEYLDAAVKGADKYIETVIRTQQTKFPNAFFWSSFAPRYINLMELYEETGQKRFLEAAHEAAREYSMFVWMCPVIPDETITVNRGGLAPWYWYLKSKGMPRQKVPEEQVEAWRLSEIGLVPESSTTSIGHRAVFMAHHAPYMMRLWGYTGDSFMHDIARSAVVGRYANFPGYHINTERTTAYEKFDYPLRPHDSISVNSFHYNHPFPMLSVLYDFLITDVSLRSGGRISFPSEYIEGYGYLQAKFYGNKPGVFYGNENIWLWMPRRLLNTGDVELNYLTARGDNGELYVALANQGKQRVSAQIAFDTSILPALKSRELSAEMLSGSGSFPLTDGRADVTVDASGFTAFVIREAGVKPGFQDHFLDKSGAAWENDYFESGFGRTRAMILDMGTGLKTAYVYLRDDDSVFQTVSLTYQIDGGRPVNISDSSYPFEFTVPIAPEQKQVILKLTGITTDGRVTESELFMLSEQNPVH